MPSLRHRFNLNATYDLTTGPFSHTFGLYYNTKLMAAAGIKSPPKNFQELTADAKKLIETYFGDIPSQPQPKHPDLAEPAEFQAVTKQYKDPLARVPGLVIGYPGPKRRSRRKLRQELPRPPDRGGVRDRRPAGPQRLSPRQRLDVERPQLVARFGNEVSLGPLPSDEHDLGAVSP